ncbi:MAG: carbamoyltransferase HypF [Myxococcota bacterium]
MPASRRVLRVRGTVQGVGFRPFVYRTAVSLGVAGAVWNDPDGVVIDAEGDVDALDALARAVETSPPPSARVESVESAAAEPAGHQTFTIRESDGRGRTFPRVSPDLATCDACLRELRDPADRRHGHPFLNCTDCGPRYSIVRAVPYDRARTTMSSFTMCGACAAEYDDPADRRFHAQPNACPDCGPHLWLEPPAGEGDPVAQAARALRAGRVVAVKGLGGFQLCCDASLPEAVALLRERKRRPAKPLAVMFPDLASLEVEVVLPEGARGVLTSPRAPIVLLPRRPGSRLAPGVAPGRTELGAFLPYTPLHHLLLEAFGGPLVMTSGNLSDEPLAASNEEARERLGPLADHLLLHDRPIRTRVDDSVVRVADGRERLLRRARGYVPEVLDLGFEAPPLLAVGADLKNTFCLTAGQAAVPSQHVGDLAGWESRLLFEEVRARLEDVFGVRPRLVAHDMHPGYHGTAIARETGLPALAVQHHHAHVAACLVDNGRRDQVLGVAWDGTGYGPDGTVWGGEILAADLAGFRRLARLRPVRLPGGDAAVRQPWRMALSHLLAAGLPGDRVDVPGRETVEALVHKGLNAPRTSSAGRLFDAVSALAGVCPHASYEGQAAAELEAVSEAGAEPYALPLAEEGGLLEMDARPLIRAVVRDLDAGESPGRVGGRLHAGLASALARACRRAREETGLETVALTGGCFQNRLLLEETTRRLAGAGFEVLTHARVPPGDGGVSLGQAAIAGWRSRG